MRRETGAPLTGLEMLEDVFGWVLRIGAAGLILITGYYIYGTLVAGNELFRGMSASGSPMSAADFQRHLQNMEFLTKILLLCAALLAIGAIGRYYGYPETGVVLLLVGAAFFFGIQFIIDSFGGPASGLNTKLGKLGDPRAYLISRYQLAGAILGAGGLCHLLCHAVVLVTGMRGRRPKANAEAAQTANQVRKAQDRFLGPCWTLPFCRDTEKKLCPVRIAKKPCWRGGRGCYCDQNIILTLSGGNAYNASMGSSGYLSRTASTISRPKTYSEKRAQCLQCPVYLHHQSQKYQLLAPLSLVVSVGLLAYYWEGVRNLYPTGMQALGRSLSGFTFGGGADAAAGAVPAWATELAAHQGLMWAAIIVGTLLVVSYLLHGVEWALYRLGI